MGNGPTEDEAEIIQHDQLSQQFEEESEVRETFLLSVKAGQQEEQRVSSHIFE